jgi:hypothetical protein
MKEDTSVWATIFLALAAALALAFLVSGCASSRPETPAANSWGSCDRSRMVSVMLVCRQTKTEPAYDLSHPREDSK